MGLGGKEEAPPSTPPASRTTRPRRPCSAHSRTKRLARAHALGESEREQGRGRRGRRERTGGRKEASILARTVAACACVRRVPGGRRKRNPRRDGHGAATPAREPALLSLLALGPSLPPSRRAVALRWEETGLSLAAGEVAPRREKPTRTVERFESIVGS